MAAKRKAARPCTVCVSEHRAAIELGLVHHVSATALARKFPPLSNDAISRHARAHLTDVMRAALLTAQAPTEVDVEELKATETTGLLAGLVAQRARLLARSDEAVSFGDIAASVAAEKGILANYTMVAKLLGQLVQVHDVRHSNLLISPDYQRLRAALMQALRPYPEAAAAVARAVQALESEAAIEIRAADAKRQRPAPKPALVIEHEPLPPLPPLPPLAPLP